MVKVIVKLRPSSTKELKVNIKEQWVNTGNSLSCPAESFRFDQIFGQSSRNIDLFDVIAPMIDKCKAGFNATVFTYGEKGSGKTFTMMGNDDDPGVKILAIRQLFKENQSATNVRQFIIRVGYVEIFNEIVYDLLNRRKKVNFHRNLQLMSNKEVIVEDEETIYKILQKGNNAKTPTTDAQRSTSHTIFQIIIESQDQEINENVKLSCLNLVDLDRSESAEIKDERGLCMDKSLEHLGKAIVSLSKGERFRNYFQSKLTRILKPTLSGKANLAIICNISPTSLIQTTKTLNFANVARKAKTNAVCNYSNDSIMKRVRAEIGRLERLKTELEPLLKSDSGKLDKDIAEMESIFLIEKNMKPKEHKSFGGEIVQILKIRPFFHSLSGMEYQKYQIGQMDGNYIDAQSRVQRKNMAFKWSDFYLERVGFEINVKMRRHLKYGQNMIGRSDADEDIDICVEALECSRKHCSITVLNDESVSLTDLNSSNGTSVNGIKIKDKKIELHEGDVITIVGGQSLAIFVGNFDCTAYRLCKFATEKIQSYDLYDEPIEISDDDDGTSYFPVKMEIETPTPQPSTLNVEATPPDCFPNPSSDTKCDSGCELDLSSYILDNSSFFDEINLSPIGKVGTSNLGNLAWELEELAKVQNENVNLMQQLNQLNAVYENDKKSFANLHTENLKNFQEIVSLKAKLKALEAVQARVPLLELKLTALSREKADLETENSNLKSKLREAEKFESELVALTTVHFNKRPKLN